MQKVFFISFKEFLAIIIIQQIENIDERWVVCRGATSWMRIWYNNDKCKDEKWKTVIYFCEGSFPERRMHVQEYEYGNLHLWALQYKSKKRGEIFFFILRHLILDICAIQSMRYDILMRHMCCSKYMLQHPCISVCRESISKRRCYYNVWIFINCKRWNIDSINDRFIY